MSHRPHAAGVVAVGDELVAGAHPDLNSPHLASRLAEVGRRVQEVRVVADDESAIAEAVGALAERCPLVVVTGGLGPTLDDVTRHAVARATERPLVRSQEAWDQVREWYAQGGRDMPASNERQTLVPEGAAVLANPLGTAPGFRVELRGATLFVLPGPPAELAAMVDRHLLPWLAGQGDGGELFRVRRFHLFDLPESVFADRAGEWMERDANPLMGVTVAGGVLSVKLVAHGSDAAQAQALLERRGAEFLERFGQHVFSETTPDLARTLADELFARNVSVATAESCTGGLVAGALTRVPGISALFREGLVTYSDEAKVERLGVERSLIEAHGAVSAEVAEAMARGAAERSGARLAVGVTGIAGPGGGTPQKPVGLVWFGVAFEGTVRSVSRRWPPAGRDKVREWATAKALALMLQTLRASG